MASSISISGWQLSGEIVLGDVDSVCARGQLGPRRADGRALCALSISHWAVLYSSKLRTLLPRRKVSPGWKACAGLRLADAATEGSNDKQGALIVSQQMRLQITPTGFMHPMLDSVQKCDISRSAPGAHKPKLQQGAGGLWSFEGSTFYAAITLWSFQGSILYVPIKSPMSRLISTLFQTALNCN